eukprot:UN02377
MTDSSYEDDDSQPEQPQHSHSHSHPQSAFSQKFGAITKQFPSAFKKAVSRERMTANEDHAFHHEKASSFGSLFKNRFQPSFRIRSASDGSHGTG